MHPNARSAVRRPVIAGTTPRLSRFARAVPALSTVLASALSALPLVSDAAVMPPWGLLTVLAWRLLRPELWHAWVAIPLGFADDLLTGQPLGAAVVAWTILFLVLEIADGRLPFRDYWLDWGIAAVAITFCISVEILATGNDAGPLHQFVPLLVMSVLCFPLVERLCAALDRWRLRS